MTKAWREANKEKLAADKKAWYQQNKDKVKTKQKERYEQIKQERDQMPEEERLAYNAKKAASVREWANSNLDKVRGYRRKRSVKNREEHPEKARTYRGMVFAEGQTIEGMHIAQKGLCDICQVPLPEKLSSTTVDHCHETGAVRGLLCGKCNSGLGFFGESPSVILKAAAYLKKHGKE